MWLRFPIVRIEVSFSGARKSEYFGRSASNILKGMQWKAKIMSGMESDLFDVAVFQPPTMSRR
jgi:hypothetical protein